MIRQILAVALAVVAAQLASLGAASADCVDVNGVCVETGNGSLFAEGVQATQGGPTLPETGPSGSSDQTSAAIAQGTYEVTPVCALGGSQTCAEVATCADGTPQTFTTFVPLDGTPVPVGTNCGDPAPPGDAVATALPQVTPGMVQRALERVPLPEPDLSVQPPGGRTLINFETNFFTAAEPFTETVTLLGRRVDLDITPSQFRWAFGDGEGLTTTEPGAPYPDLELTHTYLEQGQVRPQVTTVYTADYRVDGGPWQPVPGSVDITSDPVDLTVTEVTNQLVDYR